jgi:hypothetical protein
LLEDLFYNCTKLGNSLNCPWLTFSIDSYLCVGLEKSCLSCNMRPIFCGNLDYDARQSEIERLFSKYGRVERVDMKTGKNACSFLTSKLTS